MTEKHFEGRIALVAGASRGLGYATARELAAQGAHVLALARTVGGLEALDEEIRAAGGSATLVPLDLAKADDTELERLATAVLERWGKLDLWIHTAIAAPPLAPVEHIGAADLDRTMAVNIRAPQRMIRVLDPILRRSSAGRAVHFTTTNAPPGRNHGAYLSSKAAADVLFSAWGQTISAASQARVIDVTLPPMATALRKRFHPGEDTSRLADPSVIATRLVAELSDDFSGPLDLRD